MLWCKKSAISWLVIEFTSVCSILCLRRLFIHVKLVFWLRTMGILEWLDCLMLRWQAASTNDDNDFWFLVFSATDIGLWSDSEGQFLWIWKFLTSEHSYPNLIEPPSNRHNSQVTISLRRTFLWVHFASLICWVKFHGISDYDSILQLSGNPQECSPQTHASHLLATFL